MNVPTFSYSRMIDLSRPIEPSEGRLIHYRTARVDVDDPPSDRWYITTSLELGGHAGTHVEGPLHAIEGGDTISDLDVERFFGEAIVLDLSNCPQGVQPGDNALFYFGWERRGGELPYPATEALQWLVDRGIKLLGIGIPGDRRLPNPCRPPRPTPFHCAYWPLKDKRCPT